jgi:hypothetical protein
MIKNELKLPHFIKKENLLRITSRVVDKRTVPNYSIHGIKIHFMAYYKNVF